MHSQSIHSLSSLLPRGEPLFHFSPIKILEIFKDFSPTTRKYSKTFHQQPENIQRLFRLQNCLSRKSSTILRKYSKTFWAINNSNQQQQSTAATSSSNQQQQSAAAINSSNQQQQSTAATSSSIRQQQSTAATTSFRPPQSTTTYVRYNYSS